MEKKTNENLLEVRNLKTSFFLEEGTVQAVDGVDFDIKPGETLGLVGESGCGKSVTARSIMRIVQPPGRIIAGQILYHKSIQDSDVFSMVDVVDLVQLDPRGREIRSVRGAGISIVFQEPMTALSPVHTIGNQIMEAITVHEDITKTEARERAIRMLSMVEMPGPSRTIDQYPHELSGGMRQRALIGMALACRPNLLIADEPTTALDVTTEANILALLRRLQSEMGLSILFITHDLGVIAQMAQRVAVMYMGKIVEEAGVEALYDDPMHPYTRALLHSIPRLDQGIRAQQRLESIRGMVPDPYTLPKGCKFHPRCSELQEICKVKEPPYVEVEPGHKVRCHLYRTRV